jgi:hypothetical protein
LVDVIGGETSEQVDASNIGELDGLHHDANLERGHCEIEKEDELMMSICSTSYTLCLVSVIAEAAAEVVIEYCSFMLRHDKNNMASPDNAT